MLRGRAVALIQIVLRQDDLARCPNVLEHSRLRADRACVLRLLVNGDGGFRSVAGQQLNAFRVAGGNVGIVVGVVQPDHCAVVFRSDLKEVPALAQRCSGLAGLRNVSPVAIVAVRGFRFYENIFTLVALGVVECAAAIKLCVVAGAVSH